MGTYTTEFRKADWVPVRLGPPRGIVWGLSTLEIYIVIPRNIYSNILVFR